MLYLVLFVVSAITLIFALTHATLAETKIFHARRAANLSLCGVCSGDIDLDHHIYHSDTPTLHICNNCYQWSERLIQEADISAAIVIEDDHVEAFYRYCEARQLEAALATNIDLLLTEE